MAGGSGATNGGSVERCTVALQEGQVGVGFVSRTAKTHAQDGHRIVAMGRSLLAVTEHPIVEAGWHPPRQAVAVGFCEGATRERGAVDERVA